MGSGKTSFIGKRTEWVILLKNFGLGEIFFSVVLTGFYLKMEFLFFSFDPSRFTWKALCICNDAES